MLLHYEFSHLRKGGSDIFDIGENNVTVDVPRSSLIANLALLFEIRRHGRICVDFRHAAVGVTFQPRQQVGIFPRVERSADVQLNQIVQ